MIEMMGSEHVVPRNQNQPTKRQDWRISNIFWFFDFDMAVPLNIKWTIRYWPLLFWRSTRRVRFWLRTWWALHWCGFGMYWILRLSLLWSSSLMLTYLPIHCTLLLLRSCSLRALILQDDCFLKLISKVCLLCSTSDFLLCFLLDFDVNFFLGEL